MGVLIQSCCWRNCSIVLASSFSHGRIKDTGWRKTGLIEVWEAMNSHGYICWQESCMYIIHSSPPFSLPSFPSPNFWPRHICISSRPAEEIDNGQISWVQDILGSVLKPHLVLPPSPLPLQWAAFISLWEEGISRGGVVEEMTQQRACWLLHKLHPFTSCPEISGLGGRLQPLPGVTSWDSKWAFEDHQSRVGCGWQGGQWRSSSLC